MKVYEFRDRDSNHPYEVTTGHDMTYLSELFLAFSADEYIVNTTGSI